MVKYSRNQVKAALHFTSLQLLFSPEDIIHILVAATKLSKAFNIHASMNSVLCYVQSKQDTRAWLSGAAMSSHNNVIYNWSSKGAFKSWNSDSLICNAMLRHIKQRPSSQLTVDCSGFTSLISHLIQMFLTDCSASFSRSVISCGLSSWICLGIHLVKY